MSLLHALTSLLTEFLEMKPSPGKYILLHSLHGQEGTPLKFLQVFEMSSHLLLNCLKNKPVKSKPGLTLLSFDTHIWILIFEMFRGLVTIWKIIQKCYFGKYYFSEPGTELSSSNKAHPHIPNGPTCSGTLPHGEKIFSVEGGWGYT